MEGITANIAQFTGTIGEKQISSIFERWHIATNKLSDNDFGEDYLCDIFSDPVSNICLRTNLSFRLQVKTTSSFSKSYIRKLKSGFSFALDTKILSYWQSLYYPIILCIWCIEENRGYWCAPVEQINDKSIKKQKTYSVTLYENINEAEQQIKDYIVSYYEKIYKTNNANYRCFIYPIWMPKYRLFTTFEMYNIFSKNDIVIRSFTPDKLPSFLSSYKSLDLNIINCLEYNDKSNTLEAFIQSLFKCLGKILSNLKLDKGWVSFVLSPIDLVCEENRTINKYTDWQSVSVLNGRIIDDYKYTFEIGNDYYRTIPINSLSDDKDFLIHESGMFAVTIFGTGYILDSRKTYNNSINDLIKNAYCVWDISGCTNSDISELVKWCDTNELKVVKTKIDNVVLIADSVLNFGDYGTLIPGVATWEEYDSGFKNKLSLNIPIGKKAKREISETIDMELLDLNSYEYAYVDKCNYVCGEVLNLEERTIMFIMYCYPNNKAGIETIIDSLKKEFNENYGMLCSESDLYLENYYNSGISDFILKVVPKIEYSSNSIIKIISQFYFQSIQNIKPYIQIKKSMKEYISVDLQRVILSK